MIRRRSRSIIHRYASVWPREVFDIKEHGRLARDIKDELRDPGVYVLYRDDHPYYVGKTGRPLFDRIWAHANRPAARHYNYWNFFSAFAIPNPKHRAEVEGVLIASMPTTANSASPRFKKIKLPVRVGRLLKKRRELAE
jgi:hypothetical protein